MDQPLKPKHGTKEWYRQYRKKPCFRLKTTQPVVEVKGKDNPKHPLYGKLTPYKPEDVLAALEFERKAVQKLVTTQDRVLARCKRKRVNYVIQRHMELPDKPAQTREEWLATIENLSV